MKPSTIFVFLALTTLLASSSTTAFRLLPRHYSYIHLQPHPFASAPAPSSSSINDLPPHISAAPSSFPQPPVSPRSSSSGNRVPATASPPPPPHRVPSIPPPDDAETRCSKAMNDRSGMASCRYHHGQNYDAEKCCSYLATLLDSCPNVAYLQSQAFRDNLRRVCDQASSPSSH